MASIEVRALKKSYGTLQAVRGVDFSVEEGGIFGLIGPDGGGKTTIIRCIVSLLSADEGEILFQGQSVSRCPDYVRAHVGYMPQRFSLYRDLSVEENLQFFADLFKVSPDDFQSRLEALYEFSGLKAFRRRRATALSGGMKQKLALSCMLVHAPRVVVLDEPTFGVDPVSRAEFWEILAKLRAGGTSILVSTAYMDEALLCDRVALVHQGRILASDTPRNLVASFEDPLYLVPTPAPHRAYSCLDGSGLCSRLQLFGSGVHISLAASTRLDAVGATLDRAAVPHEEPRAIEPSLEDLFLDLIGEDAE